MKIIISFILSSRVLSNHAGSSDFASYIESLPIGSIIAWTSKDQIPELFAECNGTEIPVTTYPDLWKVIGYRYGSGTTNGACNDDMSTGDTANDKCDWYDSNPDKCGYHGYYTNNFTSRG